VAALAEPLLEPQAAEPYKPFFSSRAKIAEACVPWLKQSRTRCVCLIHQRCELGPHV
jgi:hypothetical protein